MLFLVTAGLERVLTRIRCTLFVIIYEEAVDDRYDQSNSHDENAGKLWVVHINHLYLLNVQSSDLGAMRNAADASQQ